MTVPVQGKIINLGSVTVSVFLSVNFCFQINPTIIVALLSRDFTIFLFAWQGMKQNKRSGNEIILAKIENTEIIKT